MDPESREMYRGAVVKLAKHSGLSELEIAELALSLARESQGVREDDPVMAQRRAHVGYYLIAEGQGGCFANVPMCGFLFASAGRDFCVDIRTTSIWEASSS